MLILQCSPRPNGACAGLARAFASGLAEILPPEQASKVRIISLADLAIRPCIACDTCARPPHRCRLDPVASGLESRKADQPEPAPGHRQGTEQMPDQRPDQTGWLLDQIAARQPVLIVSPVYFYALPAMLKAVIDRAQRFYHSRPQANPAPSLVAILAGRSRGRQLFSGSLLTINYFLAALGRKIADKRLLPSQDLIQNEKEQQAARQQLAAIRHWGRQTAIRLSAQANQPQFSKIPA